MIKELTIKKNGVKTHGAVSSDFDSVESFDAWILKMQESKAWGEPETYEMQIQDITAEIEAEKNKALEKAQSRKDRMIALKAIAWPTVDTVAELKAIVKTLVDETLKDE